MNLGKIFGMLLLFVGLADISLSQLLVENFGYSTGGLSSVSSSTWSGGGDDFAVTATNLSYNNYAPDNGSTNSVAIDNTKFGYSSASLSSTPTSGAVYYSFILNVASSGASSAPDGLNNYVIAFWENAQNVPFAALYIVDNSGTFNVAISRYAGGGVSYAADDLAFDTDHLIVVKYVFDVSLYDYVYVFVNPTLPSAEPGHSASIQDPAGNNDAAEIAYLVINQDNGGDGVNATIDAIKVGTSWSDAPLPVQLTNFAATSSRFGVDLQWSTETELNNYGFDIERRSVGSAEAVWSTVGFVQGAGTSTSGRDYSYTDANVDPGRYAYRIKQIDMNGAYAYYSAAEVEVGLGPKELALEPNYPNPFNPSTNITFTVPVDGRAALKVYNMLGQEVAVLFDEEAVAGRVYQKTFDASSLPTGVYVSRLEFGGQSVMRKMLFVK